MTDFDINAAIPAGTTILEASAGTGKTFTIAASAVRAVATGQARIDQLLLISFTRAASKELRDRVRQRFTATRAGLRGTGPRDVVMSALAQAADPATMIDRLDDAIRNFDAASITTIHQFCQQTVASLGLRAATGRLGFVEDTAAFLHEAVDDLFVRQYLAGMESPLPHTTMRTVGARVFGDRQASIVTDGTPLVVRFAERIRPITEERMLGAGVRSYDDLVSGLATVLRGSDSAHVSGLLRDRYALVMVDEFQDTDALQWEILRTAFHGHRDLILIGDPKQAIYRFRGGDIQTYLQAGEAADQWHTLTRNHRSDLPLVRAVETLFGDVAMGDAAITLKPGSAATTGQRILPAQPSMTIRTLPSWTDKPLTKDQARPLLIRDTVAATIDFLDNHCLALDEPRSMRPGDIAVLVPSNHLAAEVAQELRRYRIPAVVTGSASVFRTTAARDWLRLLSALERPHHGSVVRYAMLTAFLGRGGADLVPTSPALEHDVAKLLAWRTILADHGVAALIREATSGEFIRRTLARPDGERLLTDIRQIGEALHDAERAGLQLAGLRKWLHTMMSDEGNPAQAAEQRLETDADAVQVMTIHASKGLQFPVVLLPFASDEFFGGRKETCSFHAASGERMIDVRGGGPGWRDHVETDLAEQLGESLRRLYVAVTRAQCKVQLWWSEVHNAKSAPLHRVLHARAAGESEPRASYEIRIGAVRDRLEEDFGAAGIEFTNVATDESLPGWTNVAKPLTQPLAAATIRRRYDMTWQRTSYSRITAGSHSVETNNDERDDEGASTEDENQYSGAGPTVREPVSPMAALPGGAGFGTLVHNVLEVLPMESLPQSLLPTCAEQLRRRAVSDVGAEALAEALQPPLATPLNSWGLSLAEIEESDRLPELEFELPLAGGDGATGPIPMQALVDLFSRYLDADPIYGDYSQRLAQESFIHERVQGFLTGSIDAVFRFGNADGDPQFVVCDYKTNWLGSGPAGDGALSAWDYTRARMTRTMMESHYLLQASLYQVALHRYLRWRLSGYDPRRHLAGVLYLFVRGMTGPQTPISDGSRCGVLEWRPDPGFVVALDDLLAGRR